MVDARSAGRWAGTEPEPRPGLSSGHIPHSLSVPYGSLVEKGEGGAVVLKDESQLVSLMRQAGVRLEDPNSPIATTCGTGVTASVLALALEQLGHKAVTLYDGSWTEWAQRPESPIEKSSGSSPAASTAA
jgi:thiosulfate/3-mercaptopyruvate sulfurtransferase